MKRRTFGEVLGQPQPYSSREQIVKNAIPGILRILRINRLKLVRVKRIPAISALLGSTHYCTQDDERGNYPRRGPYQACSHLRRLATAILLRIPQYRYAALPKAHQPTESGRPFDVHPERTPINTTAAPFSARGHCLP